MFAQKISGDNKIKLYNVMKTNLVHRMGSLKKCSEY